MTDTDLYQPDPGPLRAAAEATELAQAVSGPVSIEGYRLAEGNLLAPLVVASESPFDTPGAVTRLREYDPATGQLVRVLVPERSVGFGRPGA